jgi:hypothetical protein
MPESPSWNETKTKMWARVKEIEKLIPSYEYSGPHHVSHTDDMVKDIIVGELRASKKLLFNILETAYEQQKEGMIKDLHKIRDDIDIFLDEVKIRHPIKWPESIPQEFLEKIVIHDSEIIREIPKLNSRLEEVGKMLLDIEKERAGAVPFDREQTAKLHSRISEVKKLADELVKLFKEREMLINLKHIRHEREYEDVRREMETKV